MNLRFYPSADICHMFGVDPYDDELVAELVEILIAFDRAPLEITLWRYASRASLN
jgi:hypothetical protein